jgi:hypothetical protein
MPKGYDPKCHELAVYFLGDLASVRLTTELAQAVQDCVEDWLESERDQIVAVAPRSKAR